MKRMFTIIALFSACYVVSAWEDWKAGKTQCEICLIQAESYLVDLKLARKQHISQMITTCGKYPTPDGSCSTLISAFNYTYEVLESRLVSRDICAFYGVCTSESSVNTTDPAIPTAPVTPKEPSKDYDHKVCEECDIIATVTYHNVGAYADGMNAGLENNCLDWIKSGPWPTKEEYKHCKDYMANVFDKLTNFIEEKSNVDYLCRDLFDVCPPKKVKN